MPLLVEAFAFAVFGEIARRSRRSDSRRGKEKVFLAGTETSGG